jgi:hypothetical protein
VLRSLSFFPFRAHGREPSHHPQFSERARGRLSLLQGGPGANVGLTSHLHVAAHHHGNGADILRPRTRAVYRLGGVEVSY